MNLDGIWGGNMFAGGSGAILPNKITSKHNFRYVPNMTGPDIVAKLRKQLDKNGYPDVEIKIVGDVPWAKMHYDTDIAKAVLGTYDQFKIPTAHRAIAPPSSAAIGRRICSPVISSTSRSPAAWPAAAAMRTRRTSIT